VEPEGVFTADEATEIAPRSARGRENREDAVVEEAEIVAEPSRRS